MDGVYRNSHLTIEETYRKYPRISSFFHQFFLFWEFPLSDLRTEDVVAGQTLKPNYLVFLPLDSI